MSPASKALIVNNNDHFLLVPGRNLCTTSTTSAAQAPDNIVLIIASATICTQYYNTATSTLANPSILRVANVRLRTAVEGEETKHEQKTAECCELQRSDAVVAIVHFFALAHCVRVDHVAQARSSSRNDLCEDLGCRHLLTPTLHRACALLRHRQNPAINGAMCVLRAN
jgi:hypothetical protein